LEHQYGVPVLPSIGRFALFAIGLGSFLMLGCKSDGPSFHTVKGKVELAGGDVSHLAGCLIEAESDTEPKVRASAEIMADGSFTLETLYLGVIRKGAVEGNYRVRLVLSDDDKQAKRRAAKAIDKRYLKFETSGLQFTVPAKEDVILKLSPPS